MKRFLLLITLLWPFFMMAQNPFIPKYDALKRSERCFTITSELANQFGSIWSAEKIDFSQDTSFNFVVYMGDRDGNGADGIAFVMHNDPRDTITDPNQQVTIGGAGTWDLQGATGDDGGGLGYAMHNSRVVPNIIPGPFGPGNDPENHKIQPSVAIEFDTWNNADVQDGASGMDGNGINQPISPYYGWDHTSVVYNGDLYGSQQIIEDGMGTLGRILPLKPSYVFGSGFNPDGSPFHNIEDGQCYKYQVRWMVNPDNTQTLQLWADIYDGKTNDDYLQLIMTHTDDMISNIFGGSSLLRIGFTGSTGGSINEQTICLLGENLQPFAVDDHVLALANKPTVINIEANDNDPDGDQLHVPIIIDLPKHGTATIFDSLDVNFVRYTPEVDFQGRDTLAYITCDITSTKCYAKCDTAFVYIDIYTDCPSYSMSLIIESPNVLCSEDTPPNGSAQAMITDPDFKGSVDFNWYEGASTTGPVIHVGGLLENVSDGIFTVEAVESSSRCILNTQSIAIPREVSLIQNAFVEQLAPFTSCTLPHDGVLRAGIVDGEDTLNTGYSFEWYYQEDPKVPSFIQRTGPIANNLEARGYTVVITESSTGCDKTISAEVLNEVSLPVVTVNKIADITSCSNPNSGAAKASIGGETDGYSFEWFAGPIVGTGLADFTGPDLFDLPPGQYTVQAIDKVTGCVSEARSIVIIVLTSAPIISVIQESPDYSCAGGMPTGILAPTVIGGADGDTDIANFTITWISDAGIPVNVDDGGGAYAAKAIDLEAGVYIIEVTDNDGVDAGCKTLRHFLLPADRHTLDINALATDQTNCYANAEIEINSILEDGKVMAPDPSQWTVTLYDNALKDITPAGSTGFPGDPFTNLIADNYYISIQDNSTQCFSAPYMVSVQDISRKPNVTIIQESPDFSCGGDTPTGILTPTVFGGSDNDPGVNNFIVSWTSEAGTPVKVDNGGGAFADKAIELKAGRYTITVTDNNGLDAGCTTMRDYIVSSDAGIFASVTDVPVSCESIFLKAGIRIEMDLDKTTVPGPYEAFVAKSDDPENGISYQIPDEGVRTILNLDKDFYDVTITSEAEGGCTYSQSVAVFGGAYPVDFDIIDIRNINNCNSGIGSFSIGNVIGDPDVNYFVQLLNVSGTILETFEVNKSEFEGGFTIDENITDKLVAGSYFIKLIQNQDECEGVTATSEVVTIQDFSEMPHVSIYVQNQDGCGPAPNGQITVVPDSGVPADYHFEWFDEAGNPLPGSSPDGDILTGLVAGDYNCKIENKLTKCSNFYVVRVLMDPCTPVSSDIAFEIIDKQVIPGQEIVVPVSVFEFENVLTVKYSIAWDSNVLEFNRTESFSLPDLDASCFNLHEAGKLSLLWEAKDNETKTLADGAELFHLIFNVIGNPGESAEIVFTDDPIKREISIGTKEIVLANYTNGSVSVLDKLILGGYIKTQRKEPVAGIEVKLKGGMDLKTTTDEAGWYQFGVYSGQDYRITPVFQLNEDSGVSTLDLVIMQWHLLDIKHLMTDYDLIACDVNKSGSLTAFDIALTRAIILKKDTSFMTGNSAEFINSNYNSSTGVFNYRNYIDIIPDAGTSDLNFTVIKMGDADHSWNPGSSTGSRSESMGLLDISLDMTSTSTEEAMLSLKSTDFSKISALQFTVEWDPAVYEYNGIEAGVTAFEVNEQYVKDGKLPVLWTSDNINGLTLNANSILSKINFIKLSQINSAGFSIASSLTPALAFNSDLKPMRIASTFDQDVFKEILVYPNPAKEVLSVSGLSDEFTNFSILAITGMELKSGKLEKNLNIDIEQLNNGVYILQLSSNSGGIVSKKFIKE